MLNEVPDPWAPIGSVLDDSLGVSLGGSFSGFLRASLLDSIWAPLGNSLWTSLGGPLLESIRAK